MKRLNLVPDLFSFPLPERSCQQGRHSDPAQTDRFALRNQTNKEIEEEEAEEELQLAVMRP